MAETLYLKDGTIEYCFGDKEVFLEHLLEEKLGPDAAWFFRALQSEVKEESTSYEKAYREYEQISDGYLRGLQEIGDILRDIEATLKNPKRLKRTELLKAVSKGITELNNYI